MNVNKIDVLCDQVIDVVLVIKEANETIDSSNFLSYRPQRFINRINSVGNYCYRLFMNANSGNLSDEKTNDLMINLMNALVDYKNSYNLGTYGYRVMNSLLDIIKDNFIELNK